MGYYLKKYSEGDFECHYNLVSDIRVMAMITERAFDRNEAKDDFDKILLTNSINADFGSFCILEEVTNKHVGYAKLEIDKKEAEDAEIGYMLLPEYWGKGIASEIVAQLIARARTISKLKYLTAIIDPKNEASKRVLTKHGFLFYKMYEGEDLPGEVLYLKL